MGIVDKAIANSVPVIPRPIVKKISSRYIAGDTLDEAVYTVRDLNEQGCVATIDLLGESTESKADAAGILKDYKEVVDALEEHDLESGISVKLTGLGLNLSEELCRANLEEIVEYAGARGRFVRVDMEDSPYTEATLERSSRYPQAAREHGGGLAGLHAPQPRGRAERRRGGLLRAAVQGHLRRAAQGGLQGLPHRQAELHPAAGRVAQGRRLRRHSDSRRVPDLARPEAHPPARDTKRPLRVPDAPRSGRGAAGAYSSGRGTS